MVPHDRWRGRSHQLGGERSDPVNQVCVGLLGVLRGKLECPAVICEICDPSKRFVLDEIEAERICLRLLNESDLSAFQESHRA